MSAQTDIAIIGMSGLFPEAEDLNEFYLNLRGGRDSVRELPDERVIHSCIDPARDYQIVGCLNRVDEFDHDFFNISLKEAEYMDPQQRLVLQLACGAIEAAGYGLKEFRGSRTAVILGNPVNSYYKLFKQFDPTALTGNMPAGLAGRISYLLDLRGPAMTVDTACSSSLVAVHEACMKLLTGEAELAVAGGISLNIFFQEKNDADAAIGILSPDGRSKTFDASANGTGAGEGGGVVILKPLDAALRDRDQVHAVIKGSAVNQDGGRSNGITAPSPSAQTEAIVSAWRRAGVDPRTIAYVEAHGTGTKLGDPIEIQGLTDAFKGFTDDRRFCAVGSVKTNIGHLDSAAGVAGLIKAVLSLKRQELFPSLHFRTANPFIDFENTAVYVNAELRGWPAGEFPRRAGVSSFGLSGTNSHLILEEAPPRRRSNGEGAGDDAPRLVTLSAKTPAALDRYARRLLEHLSETTDALSDISYSLNRGRDDYPCRRAFVVRDRRELIESLRGFLAAGVVPEMNGSRHAQHPLVFFFSGDANPSATERLAEEYPAFRQAVERCRQHAPGAGGGPGAELFTFQYALYQLCRSLGISTGKIIGVGVGDTVTAVISGGLSLEEGLRAAAQAAGGGSSFNREKLRQVVSGLLKNGAPIFVEMGADGALARELETYGGELGDLNIVRLLEPGSEPRLLEGVARLYTLGASLDWATYYEHQECYRVELPTYPFEKTRCWIAPPLKGVVRGAAPGRPQPDATSHADARAAEPPPVTHAGEQDSQARLAAIWAEVLKVENVGAQDDYFDLGGNSLIGTQIINRIEKTFGLSLEFEVLYEHSTTEQLARYIDDALAASRAAAPDKHEDILKLLGDMDEGDRAGLLAELLDEVEEVRRAE